MGRNNRERGDRVELERKGEPRRETVNVMNDKNKTELENNEGILSGPQRK